MLTLIIIISMFVFDSVGEFEWKLAKFMVYLI